MKNIITPIFYLLMVLNMYSQQTKTVYVDESYDEITKEKFERLLKSNLYDIAETTKDKKIYKKLRYKEYFGRLSKKNKDQLNKLFSSRYSIDSTKKWLFHYLDSLPNKEKMPKISGVIVYDSLDTKKAFFLSKKKFNNNYKKYINSKHRHVMSYDEFQDRIRKEKKKISKKIAFTHIYNQNNGIPEEFLKEMNYYKDNIPIFRNIFSDGMKNYKTILIFPNGNFYLVNNYNISNVKKLLQSKFYSKRKKNWSKKHLK